MILSFIVSQQRFVIIYLILLNFYKIWDDEEEVVYEQLMVREVGNIRILCKAL